MTIDVTTVSLPQAPEVLRCPATQIRRNDHVAFVSPEDGYDQPVAGEVTGLRHSPNRPLIALVVDNQVHFVTTQQRVVITRTPRSPERAMARSTS